MVVSCDITFDNNQLGTFFSGSVVSGKVEITLNKPKKIRGIAITFTGYAKTSWKETEKTGHGKNQTTRSIHYHGRKDYLASTTYLLGSNNGNTISIDPGIHTYTFACALPYQLPSSFEGSIGHIRYAVKVVLDRPWKFDHTHKVGLTVLKLVDLNYESPVLRMPPQVETNKEFWCGPCSSRPLNVQVNLPQTGYVPGQLIEITAEIRNTSSVSVAGVHFSLRKIIKYYSESPKSKVRIEVISLVRKLSGPIEKKTNRIIQESLQVPPVPPTCTTLCTIIQIQYEIQVKVKVSGFHQSPRIKIPIVIGNIPLVSVISSQPTSLARTENNRNTGLPIIDNITVQRNNTITSNDSSDLPPPSYEEALFARRVDMNEDDQHAVCRTEFVPRYPVYSFNERTSTNLNFSNVYNNGEPGCDNPGYKWNEIPSPSSPSAPSLVPSAAPPPSNSRRRGPENRWSEIPAASSRPNMSPINDNPGTWL